MLSFRWLHTTKDCALISCAACIAQGDRPVWDYQKLLGQWAEERDLTRELLSQHKVWIDGVKNGLDK